MVDLWLSSGFLKVDRINKSYDGVEIWMFCEHISVIILSSCSVRSLCRSMWMSQIQVILTTFFNDLHEPSLIENIFYLTLTSISQYFFSLSDSAE